MLKKLQDFTKRETILCIAFLLAAISCFFVPPDREYATYINVHTILILFCLMVVVAGLKESGLFQWMGDTLLKRIHSERGLAFVLVFLCFFSSMFITNDVALITFVPLAVFLLKMVGMQASFCFLITMMTIAGNLGSMLTPIGNPQNLYLYSISGASVMEFIKIMLPYTVLSGILLAMSLFLFCRKKRDCFADTDRAGQTSGQKTRLLSDAVCCQSFFGCRTAPGRTAFSPDTGSSVDRKQKIAPTGGLQSAGNLCLLFYFHRKYGKTSGVPRMDCDYSVRS